MRAIEPVRTGTRRRDRRGRDPAPDRVHLEDGMPVTVRVTAIGRDGRRQEVRLPGTVANVARDLAAQGKFWRAVEGETFIRTRDIVLIELLDGETPVLRRRD